MGFCWDSVEFLLGSHWVLLLFGFVLGSLSLPGPERVSSGVLFGVIYGLFGFLRGFCWVFVEFSLGSFSFWVRFGVLCIGVVLLCTILGLHRDHHLVAILGPPFWGHFGSFWVSIGTTI